MLNIIVSPKVHNAKGEKRIKKVVKYLKEQKQDFSVYFLHELSDMAESVKEIISLGETDFVILGDDVVINEFINVCKDLSKIKLGIIPTGRKDDFASYIGIPSDPISALKQILKLNVCSVDLMLVNDIRVLNSAVIGASVEILENYQNFKIKNFISEKFAAIKYANSFNGEQLTIANKNGKTKTENVYEMVIANGGKNRGKLVSPLSNIQDGLINVSYCLTEAKRDNKKHLKAFNVGKHIYSDDTKQYWLTNLKVSNLNNQVKVMVDGRIVYANKLEISIVENGLKLYAKEVI